MRAPFPAEDASLIRIDNISLEFLLGREVLARYGAASLDRGAHQRRLGLMEGQSFGENGVVTTLEAFDESRLHRNAPFSRSVRGVTGAAQQPLHFARPLFFLDFDESLKFAQVMGIAQGVQHALHCVIGLPVIRFFNTG